MALDAAGLGKTVTMVCSGDSGIYGMAALIYELRGESEEPEIEVIPPYCGKQRGGAFGAPLTHDFAVISLSDRLTPWKTIEKRRRRRLKRISHRFIQSGEPRRPDHLRRHVTFFCAVCRRSALRDSPAYRTGGGKPPVYDARGA
jgi:precorrin-3B C17-methyltransferase